MTCQLLCNLHVVTNKRLQSSFVKFKANEVHSVKDIVLYETSCSRRPSKSSELSMAGNTPEGLIHITRVRPKGMRF